MQEKAMSAFKYNLIVHVVIGIILLRSPFSCAGPTLSREHICSSGGGGIRRQGSKTSGGNF